MPARLIWNFRSGLYGWTETYYASATGTVGELAEAYANGAYPAARMACSPAVVSLVNLTVQEVGSNRLAVKVPIGMAGTFASGGALVNMEYQEVCAVLAAFTDTGKSRKCFIGGLPDSGLVSDFDQTGVAIVEPTAALAGAIDELCVVIADRAFSMQFKGAATGVLRWRPVLSLSGYTNGFTKVALGPDDLAGLAVGDPVYFRGLDLCRFGYLRGENPVLLVLSDGIVIKQEWNLGDNPEIMPAGVDIRIRQYLYEDLTTCNYEKIGDHDRGKPTGLPRGKSSGRKCRR